MWRGATRARACAASARSHAWSALRLTAQGNTQSTQALADWASGTQGGVHKKDVGRRCGAEGRAGNQKGTTQPGAALARGKAHRLSRPQQPAVRKTGAKKKRARAKRLIAQACRPRIKNAHSADQEILRVAPQFGWMIFNCCKTFALLCYDRLGRPLQTFMSAEIPRPLASMTRQDMRTSAGGQIPG